jgi:predicted DNA-binding transcriptional regulator AlpA
MNHDDAPQAITPRLIDKREVGKILGCGPTYIWMLVQRARLHPVRLGKRMTRFDKREVDALADALIEEARERGSAKAAA